MAGLPWIKVWTAIGDHPKVQRLEKELGVRDALGLVVRLWCWTAEYHPDGDIPREHAPAGARSASGCLRLAPARVVSACVTCGFLDPTPEGYRVHDWHEMQTTHVEAEERRRANARERQARHRAKRDARNARVTGDVTRDSVTEKEKERETEKETDQIGSLNPRSSLPSLGVVRGEAG